MRRHVNHTWTPIFKSISEKAAPAGAPSLIGLLAFSRGWCCRSIGTRRAADAQKRNIHLEFAKPLVADLSTVACLTCVGLAGAGIVYLGTSRTQQPMEAELEVAMSNWSGTHSIVARRIFSPETLAQLQKVVEWASKSRQKIRPVGTCLSPNGLSLEAQGMLSLAQLDSVVSVDLQRRTVTVQAGARVSKILEELKKYDFTLENFSSITEQQIGGWTQTSAHGTGARIPPVDEMITRMTLVTPGQGTLELEGAGRERGLFRWARVGLGALGVVSDVTLRVVPRYTLHERTYCSTMEEVRKHHSALLQKHRHVRYMWLPYTDTVVVVVSDVVRENHVKSHDETAVDALHGRTYSAAERVKPLQDLLRQLNPSCGPIGDDSFAELREKLLVLDPLNADHVARVNQAEAEFWKRSTGQRTADSTEILGFECGGVQWVLENCFPCGTIDKPSLKDLDYVAEILRIIEAERIPAPSPIEQRWSSRSTSPMSPAFSVNPDDIFSWVGIIMYITDDAAAPAIKATFQEYAKRHVDLTFAYDGVFHWGKLDLDFHQGHDRLTALRTNLKKRFDVAEFEGWRQELDPTNVFGNKLVDAIFRS